VLRNGDRLPATARYAPACAIVPRVGEAVRAALPPLPVDVNSPWTLPSTNADDLGACATLADYGIQVRAGYFVWNRERTRLTNREAPQAFPLIWARNVRRRGWCVPVSRKGAGVDFVTFERASPAIVREPAIVLQRTTNSRQRYRLVGSQVPRRVLGRYGGFVTENHTLVLRSVRNGTSLRVVLALLSTEAVDRRYRRLAGGSHVSAATLRVLALPNPATFIRHYRTLRDSEAAAELAYAEPAPRADPAGTQRKAA
jgi:adenine-specific DNA-methyltransferase